MLDVVAAPRGPIAAGADTPAAIALVPGGAGANVAAWLGYLGNTVAFVGRAGSDSHDWHAAALRAHGVEPVLARDEWVRTGVLVSLVAADGERSFLTDRGANAGLAREDLPDALLDAAGLVHLSGYALSNAGPRAAVLDFLASARARGIPISVDPGSTSLLRDVGAAAFLHWTRGARICFPNEAEAAVLTGTSDPPGQHARLGAHYETVVIKRGPAGAGASTGHGARCWTAAAPDAHPVDTTGAGDAFVAGFLSAHVRGEAVTACLDAGIAVASQAISRYGGRPPPRARSASLDES